VSETLIVLGSVTPPGRFLSALQGLADALNPTPKLINLADCRIAFADGRPPGQLGDDTARVVDAIAAATTVIFASPVYRGTYTGALKNLLDHVPLEALRGKPCGIVAMGATDHHYLGVDSQLRDVLAWFGALVAPVGVYVRSADFADGKLSAAPHAELVALAATLAQLATVAGAVATASPTPLAGRHG
jgi:FMN reductase